MTDFLYAEPLGDGFILFSWFWIIILLFISVIYIVYFIGLAKLFKKAGKNGWEGFIPIYNIWILVEISGIAWWYFLLIIFAFLFKPIGMIVSLVAKFFCFYNISKKLNRDVDFAILMTFFPKIMIPIIGFSKHYQFDKDVIVSEHGPIDANYDNNTGYSHVSSSTGGNTNESFDYGDSTSNRVIFCSNCGNRLEENSKFCGKCGKEI